METATKTSRTFRPIDHYWNLVKDIDRSQKLELATMLIDSVKPIATTIHDTIGDEVFPDMDKEFYSPEEAYGLVMKDINAEERAYWAQSVERDLADIASGKPRKYVSGDEFWSRFEEAVEKHYEDVQA